MNTDGSVSRSTAHGSYVQLNTYDEKEKAFKPEKSALPPVWPYKKCVCTKRDAVLVSCVLGTALLIIALSLGLGLPKVEERREQYLHPTLKPSSSPLLIYNKAAIVADGPQCASIAKGILEQGGNAVDAAIAAIFCSGVVHPLHSGLGGGLTMLIYSRTNKTYQTVHSREKAPDEWPQPHDLNYNLTSLSEVAFPSELRGLQEAHKLYGNISWKALLEPSINLCKEGFIVSPDLACSLQIYKDLILHNLNSTREFLNNETGNVLRKGEVLWRLKLADTLQKIAEEGIDAFYMGSPLLQDIAQCGGPSPTDYSYYRATATTSVQVPLSRSLSILAPPVSDGLLLPFVLQVLSHYNLSAADFADPTHAALQYHRIAEALKLGFSERARLQNVSQLLSGELSALAWKKISDDGSLDLVNDPAASGALSSHVSIVTQNGDAVSITSSLNAPYSDFVSSSFSAQSSQLCFGETSGIVLSKAKQLPLITPAILLNSESNDVLAAGAMAGARSLSATTLGILHALWLNDTLKQATDAPRIHQIPQDLLEYEPYFPQIYVERLLELGHSMKRVPPATIFRGVLSRSGTIETNIDYRATGSADGL